MTVKVVAILETMKARHLMVLGNHRKKKISELVEQAVYEYLDRNPVEGIEDTPLNELLINKGVEFTPIAETSFGAPKPENADQVQAAAQMPKRKKSSEETAFGGVRIVRRRVRGEPQPGHINENARIRLAKNITDDGILQAALSQKVGHTFYTSDLFDPELWAVFNMAQTRKMNQKVIAVLSKCKCFQDLGMSSAKRYAFVYLGKQEG